MKWMLFSMACALGVPTMSVAALWSDARRWLCAGLVASTVLKVSVNFYSMELYRGADRGYEVGLTDLFALSMAIGIIGTNFRRVRWVPFNAPVLFALGGGVVGELVVRREGQRAVRGDERLAVRAQQVFADGKLACKLEVVMVAFDRTTRKSAAVPRHWRLG